MGMAENSDTVKSTTFSAKETGLRDAWMSDCSTSFDYTHVHATPKRLQVVPIRIVDQMREDLGIIAERQHRSISNLIYMILNEWLAEHSPSKDEAAKDLKDKC